MRKTEKKPEKKDPEKKPIRPLTLHTININHINKISAKCVVCMRPSHDWSHCVLCVHKEQ